jgi:rhodanese-related sulfurtransferase
MINTLKRLFGIGPSVDFAELIRNGGQIIDVRTKGEYAGGHIKGSINIPLNELKANLKKIKKEL